MTSEPILLGFDTSADHCTAAVVQGHRVLAHKFEQMRKGQAEALIPVIADTLKDAGIGYYDLTAIGVGIGPGNFTGIRIAVSAARGLALGLGRPAVGVSGFDALRLGIMSACACAITARRDQLFFQAFGKDQTGSVPQLIEAAAVPDHDGPLIGAKGESPHYPMAVAIALIAGQRFPTEQRKPAPLYLRPADAAPSRDTAPTILS